MLVAMTSALICVRMDELKATTFLVCLNGATLHGGDLRFFARPAGFLIRSALLPDQVIVPPAQEWTRAVPLATQTAAKVRSHRRAGCNLDPIIA